MAVRGLVWGVSAVALLGASGLAHAEDFTLGDWQGSLDTTVSIGVLNRVQGRNPDLIGRANGGRGPSTNQDNGDLNYGTGPVSAPLRATEELKLDRNDLGFFARATEFVDFVNYDAHNTDFMPLSHEAVNQAGFGGRLLDAYGYGHFDVFDHRFDARIGRMALNWGESTFIPGGINAFNPFDVTALRSPGSELREAILPIPVTDFSTSITKDLSIEAYYQWQWQKTDIDPNGTYFSTNDLASPGSNYVTLNGDTFADRRFAPDQPLIPGFVNIPGNLVTPRSLDHEPSNWNQYGAALRYTASWLNATEFGAYYVQAASNLPVLSYQSGSQAASLAGIGKGLSQVIGGIGKALATDPALVGPIFANANTIVGTYGLQSAGEAANYYVSYPQTIKTSAVSFSTQIGDWSFQGEYSYKRDVPLQINFADVIQAGLAPTFVDLGKASGSAATLNAILAGLNTNTLIRRAGGITAANYTKFYNYNWQGYEKHDVQQLQMTATKVMGPHIGADQLVFIGEVGADYVPSLESHEDLPFNGPNTPVSGNPFYPNTAPSDVQHGGFPTKFSWGYRLRLQADYLAAIGPVNLRPEISFAHDINGISPGPGPGNFIAGRKAVELGLQATYQNRWAAEISYTNYFGGKGQDLLTDRDFVALNVKYSF
ncbi:hypothetical protein GCM10011611_61820 [Aliidongia dinghuensis]|uniref:DUF1302 domain-containing protein n=1 Tax=Aliidongia dinghuensis TaxID=1867774 RepID=A0A8J3E6R3_9PROT|nr:hypothetical protein GCM10011611_61820 [Aliidongia dinghuensis]